MDKLSVEELEFWADDFIADTGCLPDLLCVNKELVGEMMDCCDKPKYSQKPKAMEPPYRTFNNIPVYFDDIVERFQFK